jgi:nucleotide-binding universal stress UspA family protein
MSTEKNTPPRYVILSAIEESPAADMILAQAASLARAIPGAELHILHVPDRFTQADVTTTTFDLDHARRYLDDHARAARAASGAPTVGHLLEHEPAAAILQLASSLDADLIVVGTKDKHGPERWLLGSVAQKVMQRASCPVFVVRPKDHVSYHAPEIEPPCPDCLRTQRETRSAKLWCERHSVHHPRAHLHYEAISGFGEGSGLIRL